MTSSKTIVPLSQLKNVSFTQQVLYCLLTWCSFSLLYQGFLEFTVWLFSLKNYFKRHKYHEIGRNGVLQ